MQSECGQARRAVHAGFFYVVSDTYIAQLRLQLLEVGLCIWGCRGWHPDGFGSMGWVLGLSICVPLLPSLPHPGTPPLFLPSISIDGLHCLPAPMHLSQQWLGKMPSLPLAVHGQPAALPRTQEQRR